MKVLDHGSVDLVEHWGSDERIIEAARMSTRKGFNGWPQDERLLRYLWENKHSTPFEMAGAVIEVQAPIFVFREWHRHRSQSFNEASARYAPVPDVVYVPTVERLMMQSSANKQANKADGAVDLTEEGAASFQLALCANYRSSEATYRAALRNGVPKELARLVLPVARYSRMRASANLRNWLAFLTLRMAPNAQWEFQQFADAVHETLVPLFPRSMALFDERPET